MGSIMVHIGRGSPAWGALLHSQVRVLPVGIATPLNIACMGTLWKIQLHISACCGHSASSLHYVCDKSLYLQVVLGSFLKASMPPWNCWSWPVLLFCRYYTMLVTFQGIAGSPLAVFLQMHLIWLVPLLPWNILSSFTQLDRHCSALQQNTACTQDSCWNLSWSWHDTATPTCCLPVKSAFHGCQF